MFSCIVNGQIVGRSEKYPTNPALLARGAWVPEVEEGAEYDHVTQLRTGPATIVESDRVRLVYTVLPREGATERKAADLYVRAQAIHDRKAAELEAGYTDKQIRTFDQQKAEAAAFRADSLAAVPMLQSIADKRGLTVAELVDRIELKAAAFSQRSGELLGRLDAIGDMLTGADMNELKRIESEELNNGW